MPINPRQTLVFRLRFFIVFPTLFPTNPKVPTATGSGSGSLPARSPAIYSRRLLNWMSRIAPHRFWCQSRKLGDSAGFLLSSPNADTCAARSDPDAPAPSVFDGQAVGALHSPRLPPCPAETGAGLAGISQAGTATSFTPSAVHTLLIVSNRGCASARRAR